MIKLWKDEKKNIELRDIIANERKVQRIWKNFSNEEKATHISKRYSCSAAMAKKVVWIITGDVKRQMEIEEKLGKEYTYYIAL